MKKLDFGVIYGQHCIEQSMKNVKILVNKK